MVIGDPYKLSIIVKVLDKWNTSKYGKNGIFLFCIDGELFPKQMDTAPVTVDLDALKRAFTDVTVNEELYNADKVDAYTKMYNITFPKNIYSNYSYQYYIVAPTLYDNDCFAFVVGNGTQIRVMVAEVGYEIKELRHDHDLNISEIYITNDELCEILRELDEVHQAILKETACEVE